MAGNTLIIHKHERCVANSQDEGAGPDPSDGSATDPSLSPMSARCQSLMSDFDYEIACAIA